jgi:hypothetical protein
MQNRSLRRPLPLVATAIATGLLLFGAGCDQGSEAAGSPSAPPTADGRSPRSAVRIFQVSGSATHYFSTAVAHSEEASASGTVQRSTDIIRLTGDLDGYVLYHPTTVIDFAAGTLVNTGTQLFSGTVAGEGPVILHDDTFRFEVVLETGETRGEVHLGRSLDAPRGSPWFECDLDIVGTGLTPEGDGLADYTGRCRKYAGRSR